MDYTLAPSPPPPLWCSFSFISPTTQGKDGMLSSDPLILFLVSPTAEEEGTLSFIALEEGNVCNVQVYLTISEPPKMQHSMKSGLC